MLAKPLAAAADPWALSPALWGQVRARLLLPRESFPSVAQPVIGETGWEGGSLTLLS